MNLLRDPWLTFLTRDGLRTQLLLSEALSNPDIIDIALPRADFTGAAYQFLIGLLQTTFAPEEADDFTDYWPAPPSCDVLLSAFTPFFPAFDVDTSGPAFMQDFDSLSEVEAKSVAALLIDAPGEQTIKQNTDHFVKRGQVECICLPCATLALFTLQINAPSGGSGHRVGLRGGGPLTTLVVPERTMAEPESSLWQKLWLNVISRKDFSPSYSEPSLDACLFPWLGATRTSKDKGTEVYPDFERIHPLHMYWAMPRRIRLLVENKADQCDLCGTQMTVQVNQYRTVNYGYNYAGAWEHKLTPYRVDVKTQELLSTKGQQGGVGYRHWQALVLGHEPKEKAKYQEKSAYIVTYYLDRIQRQINASVQAQLWVFGYDMDNMKPRCWYSSKMPIFNLTKLQRDKLAKPVQDMLNLASTVRELLRNHIKLVCNTNVSLINQRFWEQTESIFYHVLHKLGEICLQTNEYDLIDMPPSLVNGWLACLKKTVMSLFDNTVMPHSADFTMAKNVVQARRKLSWLLDKELKAFHNIYIPQDLEVTTHE